MQAGAAGSRRDGPWPQGCAATDAAGGVAHGGVSAGLRVEVDNRNEKVGYRIREAQLQKVPYMLVIGEKEIEAGGVAVRSRRDGDKGVLPVDEFLKLALEEIETKAR